MSDRIIQSQTPQVLVVEDDRGVTRMLGFALREAGFQVLLAASGQEALFLLESRPMDAVVLDLGLPDGQGGVVLDWLRRHQESNGGPPWVVMSALDRHEATQRYGPIGGRFLAKPFDPWELARLLNSILGL
ncbi:MAG: response regulator [SAR202 cluster bacterium]|nr:response regulator [SAR202 cluster bacterium]